MNKEYEELNDILRERSPVIYELLSKKGKAIYFPKKGLIHQGADASGKRINASIGMALEDDGSPMRLSSIDKLINLPSEEIYPYTSSYGLPALRDRWAQIIREKNPSLGDQTLSRPVTTNALTHGLSMAAYLFIDEGDKIILPQEFWGNYRLLFENGYGAQMTHFPLYNNRGEFNCEALEVMVNEEGEKKILLLNFPNNPTGYTPTCREVEKITAIIKAAADRGKKFVIISDDAYFGLVYEEGICKESIFSPMASLHKNVLAVKVDGATKEEYAWGFRVGFITFASKDIDKEVCSVLEEKVGGAVRGNISSCSHLSQSLLLRAFTSEDYIEEKREKYEILKSRYLNVKAVLAADHKDSPYFDVVPNNSGYFMCLRLKGIDADVVRQRLLSHYDTGIMAIGDMIRIAYSSLSGELIEELFSNIKRACDDVKNGK